MGHIRGLVSLVLPCIIGCATATQSPPPALRPQPEPARVIRAQYQAIVPVRQERSQWCWAACLEVIFRTSGYQVSQADIVRLVKFAPVDDGAASQEMRLVAYSAIDISERKGFPSVREIEEFLASDSPARRHFALECRFVDFGVTHDLYHLVMITGVEERADGKDYVRIFDPATGRQKWVDIMDERRNWVQTNYLTLDTNNSRIPDAIARLDER